MDQSETEPDSRRQISTLVWILLGAAVVAVFVVLAVLVGRPSSLTAPPPSANPALVDQAPAREPGPTRLD